MFRSLFWNIIVSLVVVVELLSHVQLLQLHGLKLARLLCLWDSPGKNAGLGGHFFLQGRKYKMQPNYLVSVPGLWLPKPTHPQSLPHSYSLSSLSPSFLSILPSQLGSSSQV